MNTPEFELTSHKHIDELLPMMKDFYEIDGYPFDEAQMRKALGEFFSLHYFGRIWLIKLNSKVAGYMILTISFSFEFGGKDAFLDELYIKQSFRGKGIGNHAIAHLTKEATSLGIHTLHLEVEKHNRAISLYKKWGFKEHNRFLMSKKI
ncbi:GNAT family N-acetyltransferase [Limibacter armeniacum]|uniref:GNAT family N-acetyltransferase n=1 Tax=Limibacter armeniacum TaxID=466084 RepID=UPI002FE59780